MGDCSRKRMDIGHSVSARNIKNKELLSGEQQNCAWGARRGNFNQQQHHKAAHNKAPQNILSQMRLWKPFTKEPPQLFVGFFNWFRHLSWCHRSLNVHFQLPLNCFLMRALKFKLDIHGEQYIDYWTQLYRGHHHHLHRKRCKRKQVPSLTTTGQNRPN